MAFKMKKNPDAQKPLQASRLLGFRLYLAFLLSFIFNRIKDKVVQLLPQLKCGEIATEVYMQTPPYKRDVEVKMCELRV
jgi:hypothetical protein